MVMLMVDFSGEFGMRQFKQWIMVVIVMALAGCSSQGRVSDLREKTMLINFGDSKEKVLELLGVPGDRSFSGESEAWQYCSTGFAADTYTVVWFENKVVHSITSKNAYIVEGFCNQAFPAVDWGQRPADKIIDLNIK